jgi:hypothetical protein
MDLSSLDQALWAASFVAHAVLLLVLIVKARWKTFPVFSSLISFNILRDILLFEIYRNGSSTLYAYVYWGAAVLDLALQVMLVFEMARIVLKPTGTWVRDAWRSFLLFGTIGAVVAAALAFAVNPAAPNSFDTWMTKGQLFATLLTCELFASMMFASSKLGLVWRNHVMGLGQGLTAWAVPILIEDTAHSYFGPNWYAETLDHIRIVTYLLATIYWTITFWLSEPESRTLSHEMQAYLSNLQKQASFGLRGVSSSDSMQ